MGDRGGAHVPDIDAEMREQLLGFGAEKLAANFMMRTGRFFQNNSPLAVARELDREGGAGEATADNHRCRFAHCAIRVRTCNAPLLRIGDAA